MTARIARALLWLLPLFAACGGGSTTPTSPTPAPPTATAPPAPPTTPASPAPPSNFGVFTFSFDLGVGVADQELIGAATQIGTDYFSATFGRTLTSPTQIRGSLTAQGCAQGGSAAFTGPGVVTLCMANQGWAVHGPVVKRKIVVHELYHALQYERRWITSPQSSGADWIIEGSAELVGFRAIDSRGLMAYSTALGCQVKEMTDFGLREPPGLPNLNALESRQQWQQARGPLYTVSMLGMDQLIAARGITALNTYMDAIAAGTAFATAFQSAFGQTTAAFYDQFPAYRASLPVPASYQCGGV